jgi:peptide/nickel transport system substrate-binding protein
LKRIIPVLSLCIGLLPACRGREPAPSKSVASPAQAPRATPRPQLGYIDESGSGTPVDGGSLRRRLIGEPATLNAVMQTTVAEQQVLQYLSRNLLDFDSHGKLVPGLAEHLEVSKDGRDYFFTLRPEAVWEDGTAVTAEDAVFTINRIHDPKVTSPVFKNLFEDLVSVEALGPRRFVARFGSPYAYRSMSFVLPLLPEKRFAGKSFSKVRENRSPLSDGPYRLVSWKSQESIELERNARYWGSRGHFDRIVFRILPEDPVAYQAVLAGDLDETKTDTAGKERFQSVGAGSACCRLVEYYDLDYNYIALNNRSPFFSDARVRRALTMLLDRAKIVRSIFRGSARVISGPWAPDSPAYDATLAPLPFDPPAAAALLDAAGWRDTNGNGTRDREGHEFDFELLVSAGTTVGRQIDETLASELAQVGVTARVRPLEWAAFIERIDAGDFEAASLAWSASDANPDPYPYWHSSQWPPQGLNSEYYKNPEADSLMEQSRRETDEDKRVAIYHRLHAIFRNDAPAIFVTNSSQKYVFSKRVRGLVTSPLGLYGTWPGPLGWWASDAAAATPAR